MQFNLIQKKIFFIGAFLIIFISSFVLGFHNASVYKPNHGFDGVGHVFYINYIYSHKSLPAANLDWETHQSPLYYILGALVMSTTGDIKTPQYMNIFILWAIIGMVCLGVWKVFKKTENVFIAMLSLAALPMLNIYPAMVSNELLNTFWMISTAVAALFLITSKDKKQFLWYSLWCLVSVIAGVWTKVSIITIIPTLIVAYGYVFFKSKLDKKLIVATLFFMCICAVMCSIPVFSRANTSVGPSNIKQQVSHTISFKEPFFYYRMDWIYKVDMYNTQYYSLWGGAWNSFWTDGHNAITPFVKFHKKAFVLWSLGFILFPLTLYGLWLFNKYKKPYNLIINTVGLSMLAFYVYYNIIANHYSAARLTYEMAIVLPYVCGLVAASTSKHRWVRLLVWILLVVQFVVMLSFFWIQSFWSVTQ